MKFENLPDEEDSTVQQSPAQFSAGRETTRISLKTILLAVPFLLLFLFCAATTLEHFKEQPPIKTVPNLAVEKPTTGSSVGTTEKPIPNASEQPATGNSEKSSENPTTGSTEKPTENAANQPSTETSNNPSGNQGSTPTQQPTQNKPKERPLILYSYFEKAALRENALFFFKHGLYAGADFIIIINGDTDIDDVIPKDASNIKVVRRENKCFDLGAMGEMLLANDSELLKKYKKFILMNATIRGPFLPRWAKGCWTDMFLNKVTDQVKLVGLTHNCWPGWHVQSMLVATDDIGIKVLLNGHISPQEARAGNEEFYKDSRAGLNYCPPTYGRAVSTEISLTNLIKDAGYKPDVLMTGAARKGYFETLCDHADPTIASLYFNYPIHPYETVFVKVNKHEYDAVVVNKLTEWHNDWNYTSWEACLDS